MHIPLVNVRRPHPRLAPRPAREMSARGLATLLGVYVLIFSAALLRFWLSTGSSP